MSKALEMSQSTVHITSLFYKCECQFPSRFKRACCVLRPFLKPHKIDENLSFINLLISSHISRSYTLESGGNKLIGR